MGAVPKGFLKYTTNIENLACYSDDKFPLVQDRNRSVLAIKMKKKLEKIITWLTQSGMVVMRLRLICVCFARLPPPPPGH